MRSGRPKGTFRPAWSPILQQFCRAASGPIKAAAAGSGIRCQVRARPATFLPAQALVICSLPHTKQNKMCLQNTHHLTFFEQFAFREGATDIAVSVTNEERVGRTMVVRSIQERSR